MKIAETCRQYTGHIPVIVKRAVIVPKGEWGPVEAQHYLSCKVFYVWSIINNTRKKKLFMRRKYICCIFETNSHCFCWFYLHELLRKKGPCILILFSMKCSSYVGYPPLGAKKWLNMAITEVSHSCLLIELGPICNSMAASLLFNSLEDHILVKSCNGGLWKTFTGLGPIG